MNTLRSMTTRIAAAVRARRTAWMALGALAFGAMAVLGARNYIGERLALEKERLQPRHEMIELVVAKRDLRRGDTVGPETMAVRSLPREYAPGGAVVPARFETLVGSRLLAPMKSGEPLLPSAVATVESGSISSRVRPGIRAMTIAVDEVNSLSGMLQPGDRIDLMLSVRPPAVAGVVQPEITRTVMQGVPVMATGRQSRASFGDEPGGARAYTSITVEVDPDQAQKLVVAQRSGKLTAVLRNPDDRRTVGEKRLDVNMLLGLPAAQLAAAARTGPEVIVGGRGTVPASLGDGAGSGGAAVPAAPPGPGSSGMPGVPVVPVVPGPPVLPGVPAGTSGSAATAPPAGAGTPLGRGITLLPPSAAPPMPPASLPQVPSYGGRAIGTLPEGVPLPSTEGVWIPLDPPTSVPLYR